MSHKEFLEQLFYPFAAILSVKVWAVMLLVFAVGWLVASRLLKLNLLPGPSTALWWLIIGLTCASVVIAAVLFFQTPYGPDGYSTVFSLFVAVPLVVASAIIWVCKPA